MKKENFEKLDSSIKEAGEIKSGKKKPSRVYGVTPPAVKNIRKSLMSHKMNLP
jgi:hypothetical protein